MWLAIVSPHLLIRESTERLYMTVMLCDRDAIKRLGLNNIAAVYAAFSRSKTIIIEAKRLRLVEVCYET